MNYRTPDSNNRLSSPLVMCFKLCVPLVIAATHIGCAVYHFNENGISVDSVVFFLFASAAFFWVGSMSLRLTAVRLIGDQIHFSTVFRTHVFQVADLSEVVVKYRRGIPWAVFKVANPGCTGTKNFHTILRPKLEYLCTKKLSDLSVLTGVRVRYVGMWGNEWSMVIGDEGKKGQ